MFVLHNFLTNKFSFIMKNLFKTLFLFVTFSGLFISCNTDSALVEHSELQLTDTSFDIKKIRDADSKEQDLITAFIHQATSLKSTNFELDPDKLSAPEVVEYTNLSGKAIVLNYKVNDLVMSSCYYGGRW